MDKYKDNGKKIRCWVEGERMYLPPKLDSKYWLNLAWPSNNQQISLAEMPRYLQPTSSWACRWGKWNLLQSNLHQVMVCLNLISISNDVGTVIYSCDSLVIKQSHHWFLLTYFYFNEDFCLYRFTSPRDNSKSSSRLLVNITGCFLFL